MKEAVEIVSKEGCNRGVLLGLKRAWPPTIGCSHGRTEVEEDSGAATGEEACTVKVAEGELPSWDEEFIVEERGSVLVCLGLWYQVENNIIA
jgi:hypothetical protein